MAPLRNRLKDVLKSFRQGQHGESIRQARALADEGPSAVSFNLLGYFMMEHGSGSNSPDVAEKSFRSAVQYYEVASDLAPYCIETAASHGAALLTLNLWDQAKRELERGIHISDSVCLDPLLHHVTITADGCSKAQRINNAKQRIVSDLAYIKVRSQDCEFSKVMKQLRNPKIEGTAILKAGQMVADRVKSARANLFHAQLALELLRDKRFKDNEKDSVLRSALSSLDELSAKYPNSLVVCLHQSKVLVVLGHLNAAEKECCRALQIKEPDDPRDLDTPLGSTKKWKYDDRVSLVRMQVVSVLNAVVNMVLQQFDALSEEQKADFLSVKVDRLVELNENDLETTATIQEAICYYKGQSQSSRVFWRCPYEYSGDCQQIKVSSARQLLEHICDHTVDESMHTDILRRLMPCEFVPVFEGPHDSFYLARDEEGSERFCFKTLDVFFDHIKEILAGSKSKTDLKTTSLASFEDCVSRFQNENIDTSNALEEAWLRLLESCAIDKSGSIILLVAKTKWEELKDVLEKQFSEEQEVKGVIDKQNSSVVLVQEPEMSVEEDTEAGTVIAGSKSVPRNHYAFIYGRDAVRRRNSMTDKTSPAVSSNEEVNYDPYADKGKHDTYKHATLRKLPHQETCTACYFEWDQTQHINQILFHMSTRHESIGVKCPMCSVRFCTAMALGYHMYYTHNMQINGSPG